MKCISFTIFAICFFLLFPLSLKGVSADMVVVVHPDNPVKTLSRDQVVNIFMGRQVYYPHGDIALPIDHPPDSPVRQEYYKTLVDKSVAQVNAYWARLLFTGQATPPRVLPSTRVILQTVSKNRDAIAYMERSDLNDMVKVVFQLEKSSL